jgi:hypothetical protein
MTTRHKARLSVLESRQTASPRDLSHLTDAELSALLEARDRVLFGDEMVEASDILPLAAELLGVTPEHMADRVANRCPPGEGPSNRPK